MPTYEYVCAACGAASDIFHRMSDPVATQCPVCGAEALSKQMSAPAFRLKGGGWYETDFKSGDKRNLAGDDGAAKPAGDAVPAPAAGAKPAADAAPAAAGEGAKKATGDGSGKAGGDAAAAKPAPAKPASTPAASS